MEDYLSAVNKFLSQFRDNHNISGVLVCGSFVTGNPSSHSDIDLHIILPENSNYRERGNKIIDDYLIEYFANPRRQVEAYFNSDWNKGKTMSLVQFATGKIIEDTDGDVERLVTEAKRLLNKPFSKLPDFKIELGKYSIWDLVDNLEEVYENKQDDFEFNYHHALYKIYEIYAQFIGYPVQPFHKLYSSFISSKTKEKYLLNIFPDTQFSSTIQNALQEKNSSRQMENLKLLAEIAIQKMGGFNIDGFKLRSPLDVN